MLKNGIFFKFKKKKLIEMRNNISWGIFNGNYNLKQIKSFIVKLSQ